MSVAATRGSRMETWYRRLLALYPKDHRREHAEEMVGVLLAADGAAQVRSRPFGAAHLPAKWLAVGRFSLFSGTATHARSGKNYRRTGGPLRAT